MFKRIIVGLAGLALWATAGTVAAADAHVNSMSYSTQAIYGFDVINVYSSDGQQWDTFSGPPVKFGAIVNVDTRWPGYVWQWAVLNGYCVDAGCQQNPTIWTEGTSVRDLSLSRTFEIAMDDIPISDSTGIAAIPLGDEVLQTCNDNLSVNGATLLHTFSRAVPTSFSVDTDRRLAGPNPSEVIADHHEPFRVGDETRQDSFQVQVRCNPYQDDFDVDDDVVGVQNMEVFLATFSNAITRPDAFRTCRQGRILVRATTDQEGPVAVRLFTDVNGVTENEYILMWSSDVGSGVYEAEVERWVSVSETSLLQAMAQSENGGIVGMNSGWHQLQLACDTGTDDFADRDPPPDLPGKGGGFTSD